jgi:cytochrome c peroxidase
VLRSRIVVPIAVCSALLALAARSAEAEVPVYPPSLRGQPVPEPPTIREYVRDPQAAIALGKALFWDIAVGSDGQTACASCHGHAGVDPRRTNVVHPGANGTFDAGILPGAAKGSEFFPTTVFADPTSRFSARLRDIDDVAGSQGVLKRVHRELVSGNLVELCDDVPDPVFHDGAGNVRQVTARNPPSVINAVLNVRNFWDGRANAWFNGVNGLGPLDPSARVWRQIYGTSQLEAVPVTLTSSSLASQAVGPVLSPVEMSCAGRTFPTLARRLLDRRPLATQRVSRGDSVLGRLAMADGIGLSGTYRDLVNVAFWPEWRTNHPTPDGTPQVEANFSLIFGIAIQMYESTLVSDDSRYDRWIAAGGPAGGDAAGLLTAQERRGLDIFVNPGTLTGVPVGNCVACHASSAFSSATWTALLDADLVAVELMPSAASAQVAQVTFTNHPLAGIPSALPLNFSLDDALVELFRILPPDAEAGAPGGDESPFQTSVTLPNVTALGCPTDVARSEAAPVQGREALFSTIVRRRVLPNGSCGTSMVVRIQGFREGLYQVKVNGIVRATTQVVASGAYDLGYYNIGVRPTLEDVGAGGTQAGGIPLSYARRVQQGLAVPDAPTALPFVPANIHAQMDGAFKTPSLRNVELTGPYLHNGGQATLRQVMEFYNRGGDFHEANLLNLSPEMFALHLSESDIDAVVAFMKTLTDERVRDERAPFDHPELPLPNGDTLPAIGSSGRSADCRMPLRSFEAAFIVANEPADCDGDGRIDACAIAADPTLDQDLDGVPDSCRCVGDIVADGFVDGSDLGILLMQWGQIGPSLGGDLNRDGAVDGMDLGLLLMQWGVCGH